MRKPREVPEKTLQIKIEKLLANLQGLEFGHAI